MKSILTSSTTYMKSNMNDLQVGLNLAILVIPQAIAFSLLAGVPPFFGIYCAIYGVLIVAILNPSKGFHGGPNSAVAVAAGIALLPFAPQFGPDYMGMMLSLTVMVGIFQLIFATVRPLTRLLDFVSEAVISGLIFGIGLFLIFKSIAPFGGIPQNTQIFWPLIITWQTFLSVTEFGNPFAIEIGFITLFTAIIARWFAPFKRWYLMVGLFFGTLYSEYVIRNNGGVGNTEIEQVGNIDLAFVLPSIPTLTPDTMGYIMGLVPAAFAIALLGLFQTTAIVKQVNRSRGEYTSNAVASRADAVANIASGFLSALPGAGSFNRYAIMETLNARGRLASISSALILLGLIMLAQDYIAIIPLPAMAAVVMLVGANMIKFGNVAHHFNSRIETIIFIASFASVHIFGLLNAAMIGAGFALINWIWHKSHPDIYTYGKKLIIKGDMYYASVPVVEPVVTEMLKSYSEIDIDLSRMDHLDHEACRWLTQLGKKQNANVTLRIRKQQKEEVELLQQHLGDESHRLIFQVRESDVPAQTDKSNPGSAPATA